MKPKKKEIDPFYCKCGHKKLAHWGYGVKSPCRMRDCKCKDFYTPEALVEEGK